MNSRLIMRFAVRETMGLVFMAVALLWPAGRIDWWPAWVLLAVTAAWIVGTGAVILRLDPSLLAERLGPRKGSKRWDTALLSIHGLIQLSGYIVAGLDQRYGWSSGIPVGAQIAGAAVCLLGYGLVVWATASNAYFSQVVRIQTERGHTVATGGPYQYVRHPAYSGSLLTYFSMPVLLASWWVLLIGVVDALVIVLRTALEDRTLQAELPGYPEYARRVRQRLVPGVW